MATGGTTSAAPAWNASRPMPPPTANAPQFPAQVAFLAVDKLLPDSGTPPSRLPREISRQDRRPRLAIGVQTAPHWNLRRRITRRLPVSRYQRSHTSGLPMSARAASSASCFDLAGIVTGRHPGLPGAKRRKAIRGVLATLRYTDHSVSSWAAYVPAQRRSAIRCTNKHRKFAGRPSVQHVDSHPVGPEFRGIV